MKANNLTISIPNKGCDKNCPYCVSQCTGLMKTDERMLFRNFPKVLNLARMSQVSSVLLTGKGEPCLNFDSVLDFTHKFKEFPLELQTNGIWLSKNLDKCNVLSSTGMNVIALSIDTLRTDHSKLARAIHEAGMLLRICYNVTNDKHLRRANQSGVIVPFKDILYLARVWGADQLTLRKITIPNHTEETEQSKWIKDNCDDTLWGRLRLEMSQMIAKDGHHLRDLPYGAKVYDLQGVAISYSDYCIQDDNNTEDIRSLIFQEDGHVYTSWNSEASKLF